MTAGDRLSSDAGLLDVAVYYYDDVKAPLLREAVLPSLELVGSDIVATPQRGWLHGPHLRVRLTGREEAVCVAAGVVADRLTRYVAAFPSTSTLTRDELLDRAVAAGRAELVPPPYEPFVADNTVRIEVPDPAVLARIPGWPATAGTNAALVSLGIPAMTATLARTGSAGDSTGARVEATVAALAAHANTVLGGIANGHLSYRSHLEAYLHNHDPGGRKRAAHTTVWRRHERAICDLVVDACGTCVEPAAAAWRQWSVGARAIATTAADAGALRNTTYAEMVDRAGAFDETVRRQYGDDVSDFHRSMLPRTPDPVVERKFQIERFCVNTLYQLLALIDVTPAERYLAASLVCAAVEKLTGKSVRELLGPRAKPLSGATRRTGQAVG